MSGLFTIHIHADAGAQKRVRDWIAALRSGVYPQASGFLKVVRSNGSDAYCCLGVACNLHDASAWLSRTLGEPGIIYRAGAPLVDDHNTELPLSVSQSLCLSTPNADYEDAGEPASLASLNDDGASFDDIADVIERELNEMLVTAEVSV